MYLKEFALFSINFILGMSVVYLGMYIMKSVREINAQDLLNQIIIYSLFIAIGINYLRIYVYSRAD